MRKPTLRIDAQSQHGPSLDWARASRRRRRGTALAASRGGRRRRFGLRAGVGADRFDVAAEVAGVVADAFEGLEDEGGFQRDVEVARVFHRAGQQATQAGGVFLIQLTVARDDFIGERQVDAVERFERAPPDWFPRFLRKHPDGSTDFQPRTTCLLVTRLPGGSDHSY
jgi:hypothetical protein